MIEQMKTWGPLAFASLPFVGAACYFAAKRLHQGHPHAAEALEVLAGFIVDLGHGATVQHAISDASPGAQALVSELVQDALTKPSA